ncbi:MAG TPA: gluconokinase, GntK/IdnK-type [Acidimicrobiia bacterium]
MDDNGEPRGAPTIVVMGVTGVGKTTVGERLAAALHLPFLDADEFHSDEAKAKMHAGIGLTDSDRAPWLDGLHRALQEHAGTGLVLACSALKESYREQLAAGLDHVRFLWLTGDPAVLRGRIDARHGHYAGSDLLPSQLATLEPPRDAVTVDVDGTLEQTVQLALTGLRLDRRDRGTR